MAKAVAKYIRMTPRKVRRVINVIRGKDVIHARTLLNLMPYAACRVVKKVLASAVANAKENENMSPEMLKIVNAFVDAAPVYKRWRAMSRGRGYPILKRNSHITIEVAKKPEDEFVSVAPTREKSKKIQMHGPQPEEEKGETEKIQGEKVDLKEKGKKIKPKTQKKKEETEAKSKGPQKEKPNKDKTKEKEE